MKEKLDMEEMETILSMKEEEVEGWLENMAGSDMGARMEDEFNRFAVEAFLQNPKHANLRRKLMALRYLERFIQPQKGEPDPLEVARFRLGCELSNALMEG